MAEQSGPLRVLLLIPSYVKRGIDAEVAADRHPRMDYHELADVLTSRGCDVTLCDYGSIAKGLKFADLRLALLGYARRKQFDVIFCNSESIALPLGIMLRSRWNRPKVIAIGHRISTPKKQMLFTKLKAMEGVDKLFLYAKLQQKYAVEALRISISKVPVIAFHADSKFFRPMTELSGKKRERLQVCAAGLEWRDYPTMIEAAKRMPDIDFHIAAASPWSKHRNETAGAEIPSNVVVQRHDYNSLRRLYLASDLAVVPLYETDFQAGITTILEAMACGLTVITSKTQGQTDTIVDGQNGFYVQPGDSKALQDLMMSLLENSELRERMGSSAREWVEQNASLDLWALKIADAIVPAA